MTTKSFKDLPPEIIAIIAENLNDNKSLCNFSQITKYVNISVNYYGIIDKRKECNERLIQFIRQVRKLIDDKANCSVAGYIKIFDHALLHIDIIRDYQILIDKYREKIIELYVHNKKKASEYHLKIIGKPIKVDSFTEQLAEMNETRENYYRMIREDEDNGQGENSGDI